MAVTSSGQISMQDIMTELGISGQTAMNDADVRGLISKSSGVQMSMSEWYGASGVFELTLASNATYLSTPVGNYANFDLLTYATANGYSGGDIIFNIPEQYFLFGDTATKSESDNKPGLTISGFASGISITVNNSGFICGQGGFGGEGTYGSAYTSDTITAGSDGSSAIRIENTGVIINNSAGAFILAGGGGGAGGMGTSYSFSNGQGGGGGGSGGGVGGLGRSSSYTNAGGGCTDVVATLTSSFIYGSNGSDGDEPTSSRNGHGGNGGAYGGSRRGGGGGGGRAVKQYASKAFSTNTFLAGGNGGAGGAAGNIGWEDGVEISNNLPTDRINIFTSGMGGGSWGQRGGNGDNGGQAGSKGGQPGSAISKSSGASYTLNDSGVAVGGSVTE